MAKMACRRELLDRWRGIQEEEEEAEDDPSTARQRQILRTKEEWFSDSFSFLASLPKESHIWCDHSDLMGPFLETFHNYFDDKSCESPLKLLWKRISEELSLCMQCIFQHHQAQESFTAEYDSDGVGPLLKVLCCLDEERVTQNIKRINDRMKIGEYDADSYSAEVVSLMFEVLTYPLLLDDQYLVDKFQIFLEAIDNYHDVTLSGSQKYPGVYALLFLKSGRARAIGFRLAGCMGKLRSAADLDPLQPLLKKYVGFLENEVQPSTLNDSRPRVHLERTTYEEGILERYPVFLSIVLNHVSGDTFDFSYAVACLRISFGILGSKVWLRTALSPSVMRNTLLVLDICIASETKPLLFQSLESYQDGEHEKQRRNLLYFLLHQVTQSSNFSDLMRKNARKIAFLIIDRGYKMVPPCPPFECAHMWGPSLVNSLKDSSLHSSLRQPAFDLITTIIVSDASALISLKQKCCTVSKGDISTYVTFFDEEDEPTFFHDVEEKDNSCWIEFNVQSKLASSECAAWTCVPMLWHEALVDVGPTALPISFSKAVFWALSHISLVEMNSRVDLSLPFRDWLSICAVEISASIGWQTPTGSDDGGEGKESRNSIRATTSMCIPLLRVLKRLAADFIFKLEKLDLQKQWTWDPRMAESLILSLVDPDDVRFHLWNSGKIILEHLSNERLLTSALQFLCSSASSQFAILMGLQYVFHQMTCVRLLETLPAIYERLSSSKSNFLGDSMHEICSSSNYTWISDLVDWGRSSLVVIIRHWKQCMQCFLRIFKGSYGDSKAFITKTIENVLSADKVTIDNLQEQMLHLAASVNRATFNENRLIKPKPLLSEQIPFELISEKNSTLDFDSDFHSNGHNLNKTIREKVVVLSDDESEKISSPEIVAPCSTISKSTLVPETWPPVVLKGLLLDGHKNSMTGSSGGDMLVRFPSGIFNDDDLSSSEEEEDELLNNGKSLKGESASSRNLCYMQRRHDKGFSKFCRSNSSVNSSQKVLNAQGVNRQPFAVTLSRKDSKTQMASKKEDCMIRELVRDDFHDPLEHALDVSTRSQSMVSKPTVFAPKRKVIQLQMPVSNRSSHNKMDISYRRLRPARLDDWYRAILEIDYFVIVGLTSVNENETETAKLKEVPLHFQSAEHYVQIFRPLVLEEFKAQMQNSFMESSAEDMRCGSLSVVSVERIDDFHIIRGRPDVKESGSSIICIENDLVLLTKEPLRNSVQNIHALGKVERREKNDKNFSAILAIRLYLPDNSARLNKVKRQLIERSKWHLNRVMSMTPQLREFQALSSLNVIPMLPIILNPVDHSLGYAEPRKFGLGKLSHPMENIFKSSFNSSQLQAISIAITSQASRNFELSLVQGPPGTGKTKTIVAIVSACLALKSSLKYYSSTSHNISSSVHVSSNSKTCLSQSAAIARAWQNAALAKQLNNDAENESSAPAEYASKGRVLICAQSNAAVDELVARIIEGLCGHDGKMYKPFLVRVGNAKTIHPSSLPFFIDTLVDLRLADEITGTENAVGGNDSSLETTTLLRVKLEKLVERIQFYESKRVKSKDVETNMEASSSDGISEDNVLDISDSAIGTKLNHLYREKRIIYQELAAAQARERKASEESRALKLKIRKSILREAEIVVTTLSGSGGDLHGVCYESASNNRSGKLSEQCLFDVVVIDEAAQALEPASLIPLQLLKSNGAKCIMVGDPKQLPATVLSNVASKFLYECSMFERMQKAGYPVTLLTEQYRMHPEICSFPSCHFYDNKLLNGISEAGKSAAFHEHARLGPYMFFDISDGHEHHGKSSSSLSLYNEAEVEAAISIVRFLRKRYPSEFTSKKIGIITPYKSQLHLLRSCFSNAFGSSTVYDMEFNTVDGFQGREVDILLLSTVRSSVSSAKSMFSSSSGIGFVADIRRMNVALTRAKFSLWIVGNANTLQTNHHWDALVQNAKERNLFISITRPYDSIFEKGSRESLSSSAIDVKKSLAEQSCELNMRRSKLAGGNPTIHSTKRSHGSEDKRVGHEDEASKLQKQKDKLPTSGNPLQTNPNRSGEGSKAFQGHGFTTKEKGVHRFSGRVASSKPFGSTTTVQSSEETPKEPEIEKSKPDVRGSGKDLFATRKRQRDDIEALLTSALISSNKMGGSSKPAAVKQPRHAATRGANINSHKSRQESSGLHG
ncbi:putative helicase MAGATAMA 3 [Apostasia shenzhenica]|uniref:Putative helicase MAGATAMA 3 n=1 Tax=Apostasia shenzhenica TaxID=1088818 RepID=A0A2I0AM03_9ASPA|nr:putative helicase MAGATAMA 3 [Apostasia shenzhenica]